MNKFFVVLLSFISFLWIGCDGGWTTFREGTYDGKKYKVQSREIRSFSTSRIEHRFRLGSMKYIVVNALTTDWGPPYSDDIYGAEPYEYFPDVDGSYKNKPDSVPGGRTFLYFSKRRFDEEAYKTYAAFMRSEWPRIDKEIHSDSYALFPHIIGMVYGSPEDFTKEFKGTYMGQEATFTVENDGRVRLLSDGGESGHNMSPSVQMPGKKIYMDTTYKDINPTMLKTFKNRGTDPTKFFDFVLVDSAGNK